MSDYEEPPAKLTKIELAPPSVDSTMEGVDEGQEEWLSEGVLTDDDYVGGDQDRSDSQMGTSQDGSTMESIENSTELVSNEQENVTIPAVSRNTKTGVQHQKIDQSIIEQTLNNLENSESIAPISDLPDDLDAFLIRKTDGKVLEAKSKPESKESEPEESPKRADDEDDGNDTDDLLRMLGEGNEKGNKRPLVKTIKERKVVVKQDEDSEVDDDEYIFKGAKVTQLKMAKNALIRTYPTRASKAVPEESDTDMSSDEAVTVKKIFGVNKQKDTATSTPKTAKSSNGPVKKSATKHVVRVKSPSAKPVHSTPAKQYTNKKLQPKPPAKTDESKKEKVVEKEHEEIINEEEFLEEESFDLNEEFGNESDTELDARRQKQRIMRPEQMDEEVPTDGESLSGEGSMYDELPSSESEELQDWFTLDIRAERAGDYLPLLGTRAYQLLTEEKRRVTSRLTSIRESLGVLTDSSKEQADELRKASITLAELDAMLAAS